jgi:hypothetical protein
MPYIAMWLDGKKKKRSERKFAGLRPAERFLRANADPLSDDTEIYWVRHHGKKEEVLGVYSLKKRSGVDYMDLDG